LYQSGPEIPLSRVKERVLLLSSDEHRKAVGGPVALSERQMQIIEFIHTNGSVKSGDLMRLYRISRQAAGKELGRMTEPGLIRAEEKGRATRYAIA